MMLLAIIILIALNACMIGVFVEQRRALIRQREKVDALWGFFAGSPAHRDRHGSGERNIFGFPSIPPPPPPPLEEPDVFHPSTFPDEIAAAMEAEERETFGASAHVTGRAPFSEQDEREWEMEEEHMATVAEQIRKYSGDNC